MAICHMRGALVNIPAQKKLTVFCARFAAQGAPPQASADPATAPLRRRQQRADSRGYGRWREKREFAPAAAFS